VSEVRSFRRVFDLERRIYSVDGLRLNPTGVPVRGVVYLLAAIAAATALGRAPLIGAFFSAIPWYLRELAIPAATATVLATIRIDGRTFHRAAESQLRLLATPRRVGPLGAPSIAPRRWIPPDLLFLPDGSDARLRGLRYKGPGAVLVAVRHERTAAASRPAVHRRRKAPPLMLRPCEGARRPARRRVIYLRPGSILRVTRGGAP
jgi:hypothetical protein